MSLFLTYSYFQKQLLKLFFKKTASKNFAIFTEKHLYLFLKKIAEL